MRAPSPADRATKTVNSLTASKVFIDPLPFEKGTEELGQFLAAFGEVEEVPWLQGMWRPLEFIVAASWYLCDS